jgi:VIT1/CCC1 family predicted Fe2+/Mn2+ transporter
VIRSCPIPEYEAKRYEGRVKEGGVLLSVHCDARDKFGITETLTARPLQAALTSSASFSLGAALPLLVTAIAPEAGLISLFSGISLVLFALLGGVAARTGGAGVSVGAIRVLF